MSQWQEQIAEFQRTWVNQQQKVMTDWLASLQSPGAEASPANWRKAADVMEKQVTTALDTQKRSLMAFAENIEGVEGAPEAFAQAVSQLEEGLGMWSDLQLRLWKVWFDMLRATAPVPQNPGEAMLENWQDMVRQSMSIQEQWLSNWTTSTAGSGAKTGSRSPNKSASSQSSKAAAGSARKTKQTKS